MNIKKLCGAMQHSNGSTFAKEQMSIITDDNKHWWKRVVPPPDVEDQKETDISLATTIKQGHLVAMQLVVE